MTAEELLIAVYEDSKIELRQITKMEKEVHEYLRLKIQWDKNVPFRTEANKRLLKDQRSILRNRGFANTHTEAEIKATSIQQVENLILHIISKAKKILPDSHEVSYVKFYNQYLSEGQLTWEAGFSLIKIQVIDGDKFYISPYGYVYRNDLIFGRILKDESIRPVSFVQGGFIKLDSA